VISYFGNDLLRESWIAGMPIPSGISELDVAGLTPLPSKKVKPGGIAECPVNIDCYSDWNCHLIGTFEQWLEDEQKRGKLSEQEKTKLFELNAEW